MSRVEVLCCLALLVAAVTADQFGIEQGTHNVRVELIVGGLVAAWTLVRTRATALLQTFGLVEAALCTWLVVNVVSSLLFSPDRVMSLEQDLLLAGLLTICAASIMLLRSREALTWAALMWVAAGTVLAIVGVANALLYNFLGSTAGISLEYSFNGTILTATPRVKSLIWEPNIFGSFLLTVVVLSLVLSLAPRFQAAIWQRAFALASACAAAGVVLSMTRTVWVLAGVMVVVLPVLFIWTRIARLRQMLAGWLAPALLGVALGIVIGTFLMPTLSWPASDPWSQTAEQLDRSVQLVITGHQPLTPPAQTAPSSPAQAPPASPTAQANRSPTLPNKVEQAFSPQTNSVQTRQRAVSLSFDAWLQKPILGWGTNSFAVAYPPPPDKDSWIGNLELHVLFDTGLVGFFCLLLAGIAAVWSALRALLSPRSKWGTTHYILLGLLIGMAVLLAAYQITDGTWLGFTWAFFAMLVAGGRLAQNHEVELTRR